MRRDKTMQVILNTKLVSGMEPSIKDASIYFRGTNVSGEPRSFAIKVGITTIEYIFMLIT
jgi:hypothetical protein